MCFFFGGLHGQFARLIAILTQFAGVKLNVDDLICARFQRRGKNVAGLFHVTQGDSDDVIDAIALDV